MPSEQTSAFDIRMGRRVTLRDLQVLLAVAQFGSMAKAASHLSITQPAVSQAVANLERAFGARLIDRGPHGAMLTRYGEAIQKRGTEVFDVLKQGSRDIEYLSDAGTGDVWIGANEVLLGGLVPAVVQRLAEAHPNIVVHALTANTSDFDSSKSTLESRSRQSFRTCVANSDGTRLAPTCPALVTSGTYRGPERMRVISARKYG